MNHRSVILLVAAASLAAVTTPAAAQSPALSLDRPCYVEQQPMVISGTAFTPGSHWTVSADQLFASGDSDAGGSWATGTERAPIIVGDSPAPRTFTLTANQDGAPVATLPFQVVNHTVKLSPSRARPTSTVTWQTAGWPTQSAVYVHVRRSGRTIGTTKLGRTTGACGTLRTRKRFMPVRGGRVPTGLYTYQLDLRKAYRSTSTPQLRGTVSIYTRYVRR